MCGGYEDMEIFKAMVAGIVCMSCVFFCSCMRAEPATRDILIKLTDECEGLPDGKLYFSGAEEGSEEYMPQGLIESLYGKESLELFEKIEEYSVYISSFALPYEMAVFCCYSASDADEITLMCASRADNIRVALRGTALESRSEGVRVSCKGKYVVMTVTDDPDKIHKRATELIR